MGVIRGLAVAAVLAFAGCGGGGGSGPPYAPTTAGPTAIPSPSPTATSAPTAAPAVGYLGGNAGTLSGVTNAGARVVTVAAISQVQVPQPVVAGLTPAQIRVAVAGSTQSVARGA
ncbi:MAG: hypothetical protein JOY59_05655, partial [Candidatus Eremiobacteraeota bacterium]|nr:hypothetical protein [Candidatus Eremiobacteraeota bacterium]